MTRTWRIARFLRFAMAFRVRTIREYGKGRPDGIQQPPLAAATLSVGVVRRRVP
jgi:hypothetical protein